MFTASLILPSSKDSASPVLVVLALVLGLALPAGLILAINKVFPEAPGRTYKTTAFNAYAPDGSIDSRLKIKRDSGDRPCRVS